MRCAGNGMRVDAHSYLVCVCVCVCAWAENEWRNMHDEYARALNNSNDQPSGKWEEWVGHNNRARTREGFAAKLKNTQQEIKFMKYVQPSNGVHFI